MSSVANTMPSAATTTPSSEMGTVGKMVTGYGQLKMFGAMIGFSILCLYGVYTQWTKYNSKTLPKSESNRAWWFMIGIAAAWLAGLYLIHNLMKSPTAAAVAAIA